MVTKYTCDDEMIVLLSIDRSLKTLLPGMSVRSIMDGWSTLKVGKSWFYEKTITYTGNAENHDINFPVSVQINRIEQIWDDGTAKDFSIQVFSNPSSSYYTVIRSAATNTDTSRWLQLGIEYKFPAGTRLRFAYSNTTASKIVTIKVQVDEL